MKKIILLLLSVILLLTLAGCSGREYYDDPGSTTVPTQTPTQTTASTESSAPTTVPTEPTTEPTTVPTEPPYIPEISPDTVGIYIPADDGTKARTRITEFSAKRTKKTDIDCFEIFASTQERVSGTSFASMWSEVWESHEGWQNAKIGFHITFALYSGEVISRQLLKPSDAEDFYEYLEIYMYDDINQTPGQWYTHLDDGDMDDKTIISSIKLTSGSKISQVGDIILTAFIYDGEDCFDAAGNYIGLISASITITE